MAALAGAPKAARFIAGDPVRGLVAFVVVLYHGAYGAVFSEFGPIHAGDWERSYGEVGGAILHNLELSVWVFFVLSGYLLGRPFTAAVISGTRLPRLRSYARNRLLRIVPAFWVAILLYYLAFRPQLTWLDAVSVPGFFQIYHRGGLVQYMGHTWTVNIEALFYLSLPAAAFVLFAVLRRLSAPRARLSAVLVFLGALFVFSLWWREQGASTPLHLQTFRACLFAFVPGIALAAVEPFVLASDRARQACAPLAWIALLAAFACFAANPESIDLGDARRAALAAVASGAFVAAPLLWQWSGRGAWRLYDNRVMHWVGERSYSLYLLHNGIFILIGRHLVPAGEGVRMTTALIWAIGVPLSLAAAAVMYRCVERPMLSRKGGVSAPADPSAEIPRPARRRLPGRKRW